MGQNTLAIIMMCVSMALTTSSEACVKLLSGGLPTSQILVLRATIICLFLLPVVIIERRRFVSVLTNPIAVLRALAEGLASDIYYLALGHMPLPTTTALFLTAPLMTTVAAAIWFNGQVGWRGWTTLMTGFGGVLLILHPSAEGFNPYAILILLSAAGTVARDLLTTRLSLTIPSVHILFMSVASMGGFGFALSIGDHWRWPGTYNWELLSMAAVTFCVGSFTTIRAFRLGEVAVVAPFRYTVIVWSSVLGFFLWGYVIKGAALIGVAAIIGSGIYTLRRERMKRQEAIATMTMSS